ncbi:MAG: flagellar biosynthesis protein FlhA [Alphaproteobacteria bacterium]|nr:MAG: flagellar biosynthesis protein FlhA [Alphaproteobacteria bacterium]TAF15221.1 MAG: flagellar biosynthesis protein FlhA [Alphaproteobacteria bacterium]TAF76295.1 MAG: flagellar biosynthesis protein FlhA [Alphaproteobacteria bacterium]
MASPARTAAPQNFTMNRAKGAFNSAIRRKDIFFALAVVGILVILMVPVPPMLLDLLLGISITLSVLILMTVLFVEKPLGLSSFPTILLLATMLRLSLNIASTRLILTEGHSGTASAGQVIEAFGHYVMGGQLGIGIIIFCILTIINFVVITKGSGRIAEVSARFSLDAMPGKQMAIDADLSAGLIDEDQAKERRRDLEDESTFYGSMDGASKFVRGDAVAGLLITGFNLIGGITIGIMTHNLSFSEASETYTILTIGDGLVSQIPALIVSTAAGMLVTKAGVRGSSEKAVLGQLQEFPAALGLTSFLAFVIGTLPGMPAAPFFALAAILAYITYVQLKIKKEGKAAQQNQGATKRIGGGAGGGLIAAGGDGSQADGAHAGSASENMATILQIDTIRLELGYGLLPLINYQKGHRLTEQIKALRKQVARDLGLIMPSVRIQDNMQLPANTYVLKVKEMEAARGVIRPDMLLVMDPSGNKITLPGEETVEPTFGLPAMWITDQYREEALFRNLTVVDPPTVITTHLTEVIKENISDLLSYTETQKLLDEQGKDQQKLIAETIPSQISVSGVQRILQNLLREHVSIRDIPAILEAIAESSANNQNLTLITEHVRARLSRQICFSTLDHEGLMPVLAMSPQWEQIFVDSLSGENGEKHVRMAPSKIQEFMTSVRTTFDKHSMQGHNPVLLVSPVIRPYVRSVIERFRPNTTVLSQNEVHPRVRLKTLGQL